jgi:hypothetical protein
MTNQKVFSPDDDAWIDDLVAKAEELAAEEVKAGAVEVTHTGRIIGKDELWILHAVKCYDDAPKQPLTGHIHKETASRMLGMLMQVEDPETLIKLANCSTSAEFNHTRGVMARLGQIACKRKHIRWFRGDSN